MNTLTTDWNEWEMCDVFVLSGGKQTEDDMDTIVTKE